MEPLSVIDPALLESSPGPITTRTPYRSMAAAEPPSVQTSQSLTGIDALLKAAEEPSVQRPKTEKTIQFDLVLLLTAHGTTPPSALSKNSDGTISINPLLLPEDMNLTMMCSSEFGVTTCDYLHLFKQKLMGQIGHSLDQEQFVDLKRVQTYFRELKTNESKKDVKQTLKEYGAAAYEYMNKGGWQIAHQCVERYYVYNDAEDAQTFSDFDIYKPFQVLYQNSENTNKFLSDENIFQFIKDRFGYVTRSRLLEYIHARGFKNICIFDTSCGTLSQETKTMLGITGLPEDNIKYRRTINPLRREAISTLTAGKRYKKNKSRKRRKSRKYRK
jgi:hypothetical protein